MLKIWTIWTFSRETNNISARTCSPGCSQNRGTEPRICMKEETQSSKYITYKKSKEKTVNSVLEKQLLKSLHLITTYKLS